MNIALPSENLLRARRALDGISSVTIVDDWKCDADLWFIHILINIGQSYRHIPRVTYWYVVVEASYPYGKIKIFPSVSNGITVTFQHQANNARISPNGLWREGSLCTEVTNSYYEKEPMDADSRLAFHIERAIRWLHDAGEGKLTNAGDRFELPDFCPSHDISVVFSEDPVSLMQWEDIEATYGIAKLYPIKRNETLFYVHSFYGTDEEEVLRVSWGDDFVATALSKRKALWIMLKTIPVMDVWQAPYSFGDLKDICANQGINLMELIKSYAPKARDGREHFILVGFPIPRYVDSEDNCIHWQALRLPIFAHGKDYHKGFRKSEKGYWLQDSCRNFKSAMYLQWVDSQNWSENEIAERGKLNDALRNADIAIIGCGCIGSSMSEMLVRSGATNLTLFDQDVFQIGNLSRHTLTLNDVEKNKVYSLKDHLTLMSPHARIKAMSKKIRFDENGSPNEDLKNYDLIIDCSGDNTVLTVLSETKFKNGTHIISLSIGIEATHIYLSMQRGPRVDYTCFGETITPFLESDNEKASTMELPRDGIGCWHPTFPARFDDIAMVSSIAIKLIEKFISECEPAIELVLKRQEKDISLPVYDFVKKVRHE